MGDVNGDGLEDFFIGNAANSPGAMYLQTKESTFTEISGPWISDSLYEDTGALLFDADNDGNPDLYVVSGGNDGKKERGYYQDRLYLNTDQGFVKSEKALPVDLNQSGKCIKAADFDNDGDLDLFLGGAIVPGKYPVPADSYILKNNGKKGADFKYDNVTEQIAPELMNLGLVTDAVWNDFDDDGDKDLIIVGEWMKIQFFENTSGIFKDITKNLGFDETVGWWMSINIADLDGDGDNDFLVGNIGTNIRYKTSDDEPFEIYSNDFDVDGHLDIVLSHSEKGIKYPVKGLDASSRQIPVIRLRYGGHEKFAGATLEEIYGEQMLKNSLHYRANTFANCWIENLGKGRFEMHKLPVRAQLSAINDMVEIDYLNNGHAYVVAGNFYSSEVEVPRSDASIGLVITVNTHGEVYAIPPAQSNLLIKGEVKAIEKIKLASGKEAVLFAINNGALKLLKPVLNP